MPRLPAGRVTTIAALLAIVALGIALRLIPWWRGADRDLYSDPAFHLRMTRMVAEHGRLPVVDSLASAPVGREVDRLLPTGLYWAAGAFHRVAAAFDRRDLETHARMFVALAGALVALPAYGAARALFPGRMAALVAALIAVVLPAYLHRSFSYWFRYEALGTPLITAHVAFSLAALAAPGRRASRLAAVGAGLATVAALAVWRVAFILPVLEVGFVLVYVVFRPPGAALREWFSVQVAAGTVACLALGYLRDQAFLLSTVWLLTIGVGAALWTPWLMREAAPRAIRAGVLALVSAAAVWAGSLGGRERQYAQVVEAARHKLATLLGVAGLAPGPVTRMALNVDELQGSSAGVLFGAGGLSWLSVAFLAAPLVWLLMSRDRGRLLARLTPAPALLAWLAVTLTVITLFFSRNKSVLAPLVAVVIGGIVAALRAPAAGARTAGSRPRGRWSGPGAAGVARGLALALLAACFAVTVRDAVSLAVTRESRLDPGLKASLDWLARETPPDAVVLAPWQHGYEIQTYAGRGTVIDGLLEDPPNRGRIVEIAGAMMEPRTDALDALCERTGADYVLLPPSSAFYGIAQLTDWPAAWKTRDGVPLNREEADRVLVKMMVQGASAPPFEKAFESGPWRVYRRGR